MKFFTFLFFSFYVVLSFAQDDVILMDDFNARNNGWQEGKTNLSKTEINTARGLYIIQYKADYDAWTAWKDLEINEKKDFEIEALFYKDKGVKNYGYGLLWGGTDNNYYSCMITGNGFVCVGKVVNGIWEDITPEGWIKTGVINEGNNKYNTLTVRKIGNGYEFDVNNNTVIKIKCGPFFGNKIGFNINNKQRILVDWIKVSYLN